MVALFSNLESSRRENTSSLLPKQTVWQLHGTPQSLYHMYSSSYEKRMLAWAEGWLTQYPCVDTTAAPSAWNTRGFQAPQVPSCLHGSPKQSLDTCQVPTHPNTTAFREKGLLSSLPALFPVHLSAMAFPTFHCTLSLHTAASSSKQR